MTLDRYSTERGIDFVPAIDVDTSVTSITHLQKLRPKLRDIISCFDRPKFIHLGPNITNILTKADSEAGNTIASKGKIEEEEATSIYDFFPASMGDTNFLLCANSLPRQFAGRLPENAVLVHYGFQVIDKILL